MGLYLSIWAPRLVYEQSLFWCIYLVPSNSFQTELFLTVVPAVCNKTCCIALLPFPQWHENNRLSRYGTVFVIATDKQLSANKRCPYLNSAAYRNVRNLEHNEIQEIMTFYLLEVLSVAKCYRSGNAEWDPPVQSPREKWVVLLPERWAPAWLGMNADGGFWPPQPEGASLLRGSETQGRGTSCHPLWLLSCYAGLLPPMRWSGLGHHQLLCRLEQWKNQNRLCYRALHQHLYLPSAGFAVWSNSYVIYTISEGLIKWTVLYIDTEKALLSCTALSTHERGPEVYASFKFKSQRHRFVLQGWHLTICPTSLRLNLELNLGQVSGQNVTWHQCISVAQHAIWTSNVQFG